MALLQKMGWRPGEGLGKNKEGALEPLQLEVKLDKKGLVSEQDIMQKVGKSAKPSVPTIKTLEGIYFFKFRLFCKYIYIFFSKNKFKFDCAINLFQANIQCHS